MYRIGSVIVFCLMLSGCNTWQFIDDSSAVISTNRYTVRVPVGWVEFLSDNTLLVTKDGPDLQKIQITYSERDKAFEAIKKSSSVDMLPTELAELYIANFRKQQSNGLPSLQVLSNAPATVDGHEGFQLNLQYKVKNGLLYHQRVTGFATKDGFYTIFYRAPALHYYSLDDGQYEAVLHDFKMKG